MILKPGLILSYVIVQIIKLVQRKRQERFTEKMVKIDENIC